MDCIQVCRYGMQVPHHEPQGLGLGAPWHVHNTLLWVVKEVCVVDHPDARLHIAGCVACTRNEAARSQIFVLPLLLLLLLCMMSCSCCSCCTGWPASLGAPSHAKDAACVISYPGQHAWPTCSWLSRSTLATQLQGLKSKVTRSPGHKEAAHSKEPQKQLSPQHEITWCCTPREGSEGIAHGGGCVDGDAAIAQLSDP